MTLLSYNELNELIDFGVINANPANVNGTSIDITLDKTIILESEPRFNKVVNLAKKENIETREFVMSEYGYMLRPSEFVLASSAEVFNLPENISAEYKLKSSLARNGLEHLNAGWCDPWWSNSKLTLELKNMTQKHDLVLSAGMKIGQIVFFKSKPVPKEFGYAVKGQYNNQEKVTASKGIV